MSEERENYTTRRLLKKRPFERMVAHLEANGWKWNEEYACWTHGAIFGGRTTQEAYAVQRFADTTKS